MVLPLVALGHLGPFGMGTLFLWLVGQIVPGYRVEGFGSALFGAILVVLAGFATGLLFFFPAGVSE